VIEKREFEDVLPAIYEGTTGRPYDGADYSSYWPLGRVELELLRDLCDTDELRYQLVRDLLAVEREYRTLSVRSGMFKELVNVIKRHGYEDAQEAERFAHDKRRRLEVLRVEPTDVDLPDPELLADGYLSLTPGPEELLGLREGAE
jgi:DNA sulfur modification protein DndC